MKVICIDDEYSSKEIVGAETAPDLPRIPEGSVVTVIDSTTYKGILCYRFAEYVDITGYYRWWYEASHFIPISEIDETKEESYKLTNLINNA